MLLAVTQGEDAPWWLTGGDFGLNGSVVMSAVIAVLLLWALSRSRKARAYRVHDEDYDFADE